MQKEWVALAVRVTSIFIFLYGTYMLTQGISLILSYRSDPELGQDIIIYGWILALTPFPIALLMWFFPLTLARKIIPTNDVQKPVEPMTLQTIQHTVLIVLGLFLLAYSVPDLFFWSIYVITFFNTPFSEAALGLNALSSIITTILEVLLGVVLVFGSDFMQKLIRKLQRIGLENK